MTGLLVRKVRVLDAEPEGALDLLVVDGRVAALGHGLEGASDVQEIDATGAMLCPPYVEPHFHLDSALTLGQPRWNESGTLLEGIACWKERKVSLSADDVKRRARTVISWFVANGTLALRSHVDCSDERLVALRALVELREELRPTFELQLVAFPQEGIFRYPGGHELLEEAVRLGADAVGAIPHFERSREAGVRSVHAAFDLAARYGKRVDIHCDETDDEHSRFVEVVAEEAANGTVRLVTASHVTASGSHNGAYLAKLGALLGEGGVDLVVNPLINLHLQGRFDAYPRRRGLAPVKELLQAGVNVAFGHDCVMDPWYPLGMGDQSQVAFVGAHAAQLLGRDELAECHRLVSDRPARVLGIESYGAREGQVASFLLVDAESRHDLLRRQARPWLVVSHGRIVARRERTWPTVELEPGRAELVRFGSAGN